MLEVEAAIRRVIEDVTPHVVLTFDPHGGYYHPDHLAVQRATTAAFFSSGAMGTIAPERLFYATMLCEVFRGLAVKSRGRGIVDGLDPDVFGTASEMVAVSFDAAPFVQRKFLALAAHRSAFGVTEEMLSSPPAGITRDARCVPSGIRARSVRSGRDAYCNLTMALERLLRRHRLRRTRSGQLARCGDLAFQE